MFLTSPLRRKPNLFILGFHKCGTTYLADLLRSHACMDGPNWLAQNGDKETYAFMPWRRNWMPVRAYYNFCFASVRHAFEATPIHAYEVYSMRQIKRSVPDAKVVMLVRGQRVRFESHVNYFWLDQREDRSDVAGEARWDPSSVALFQDPETYRTLDMGVVHRIIEKVMANEAGRIQQDSVNDASLLCVPEGTSRQLLSLYRFVARNLYDIWVTKARHIFGGANVLVMSLDELKQKPAQAVRRVWQELLSETSPVRVAPPPLEKSRPDGLCLDACPHPSRPAPGLLPSPPVPTPHRNTGGGPRESQESELGCLPARARGGHGLRGALPRKQPGPAQDDWRRAGRLAGIQSRHRARTYQCATQWRTHSPMRNAMTTSHASPSFPCAHLSHISLLRLRHLLSGSTRTHRSARPPRGSRHGFGVTFD